MVLRTRVVDSTTSDSIIQTTCRMEWAHVTWDASIWNIVAAIIRSAWWCWHRTTSIASGTNVYSILAYFQGGSGQDETCYKVKKVKHCSHVKIDKQRRRMRQTLPLLKHGSSLWEVWICRWGNDEAKGKAGNKEAQNNPWDNDQIYLVIPVPVPVLFM
jgi:hypothetical protein